MHKIAFIVNPISGGVKKGKVLELIEKKLDRQKFEPEILKTQHAGHASDLAIQAKNNGFKYIVAVGGDGTINEVSKALLFSDCHLGIIPVGSGNGYARHLGIPMNTEAALDRIQQLHSKTVDTGKINNKHFVATCGVGFDAHIGKIFATIKGRGFSGYIKACLSEFAKYESKTYTLKTKDTERIQKAFLITFANTSQYGNNAYIAPLANETDGLMDVCILKPFSNFKMPTLSYRLFAKNMHKSSSMITFREKSITVLRDEEGPIHIDGEPDSDGKELFIEIVPKSLNVLC